MTKEEFLNLEIGKTFTVGNITLVVSKDKNYCRECYFEDTGTTCGYAQRKGMMPMCDFDCRKDRTGVIFIEVEDESME